jgi:CCR4-NOT transcription complex subunit 6
MSVSIVSARLPTGDTPVCSVTLEPYVLIKRGETTVTADDIPEEGASEPGLQLRSRWYRSSIPRGGAVCSVHPEKEATVQCAVCLRSKVAVHLSYHCTAECFKRSWPQHLEYHRQAHANGEQQQQRAGCQAAAGCCRQRSQALFCVQLGRLCAGVVGVVSS